MDRLRERQLARDLSGSLACRIERAVVDDQPLARPHVCAAMLSASRRRFVASLRAGVTTEYRSGRLTSRRGRDTLARARKRARHEGREPNLQHEESVEGVSRHRLSRAPLGDQAADAVHGDELLVRGAVGEQEVGRAAFELGAKPSIDGEVEEAGFRLVDDPFGDEAARDLLEEVLRRAAFDLERRRDRGCEFHDTVVEKRHPHFERVRHRRAVGVVEHVVDEPELGVEEKASAIGPPLSPAAWRATAAAALA